MHRTPIDWMANNDKLRRTSRASASPTWCTTLSGLRQERYRLDNSDSIIIITIRQTSMDSGVLICESAEGCRVASNISCSGIILWWHISAITCQMSYHYVDLSKEYHHNQQLKILFLYRVNATNCRLLVSLISDKSTSLSNKSKSLSDKSLH